MKRIIVTIIAVLFAAALGLLMWYDGDCEDVITTDSQLNVAFNIPLTGVLSTYGEAIRDGALLALNDYSGELDLSVDFKDNRSEAKSSVNIFQQQMLSDVDLYVSGVKPQTMSIIDNVSSNNIPHFTWVFDAFITEEYPNTFRTWVSYKIEPQYYFKYINDRQPKKVAITYVKLPHTDEEFQKIVIPFLESKNIDYIVEEYLFGETDAMNTGSIFKDYDPDLIIVNGFKGELMSIIKYFKEIGLTDNEGNTICTYDFLDATEDLSSEVETGVRFISPEFHSKQTEENASWAKRFESEYNRVPRYTDAYAYDMMHCIILAANEIEDHSDYRAWTNALSKVKFVGVTGDFEFDESGDLITNLDIVYLNNDSLIIEIE